VIFCEKLFFFVKIICKREFIFYFWQIINKTFIMDRRSFIIQSSLVTGGMVLLPSFAYAGNTANTNPVNLYELFKNPAASCHPFVRWWWNGDKIQAKELVRELQLLKEAGIGGVEINPVKFPEDTDDLGVEPLQWLSDEWIDMLQVAFDEAKRLGLTCDLIVGSGWPFGAEYLQGDERGQVMVIGVQKLEGPLQYETSEFNLLKEAEPAVSHPYSGRLPHLISLKLLPDPVSSLDQVVDLSDKIGSNELFKIDIPKGKHALYALVRIDSFGEVINGAPGATGPTLNHLDKEAVLRYLTNMSGSIEKKIGPLSKNIRALFTDSLELEGANWTKDMAEAFQKRNGYDIMPYLPYTMYKTGGMGNVLDYKYGAEMEPEFKEMIDRMRYDVEVTKAEMFLERFCTTYTEWCHKLNVKSRAQAYGRGFFPLESSMKYDIPEGESWTTNWLQHRIGEEMSNDDYRRGRSYTMVNKYVSSGAHLSGKRLISAEEMTNTYRVFNMTLEFLKMGCDMNAMAGITHSIFHGFNYSPAEAPFPGWIRYGAYYNEKNNWWPYFKYFNQYRARVSALLQNADMYADIAILPPVADMWTTMGMQNEPFPSVLNAEYQTLLWEAMNKSGNGTDYLSESVIRDAQIKNGRLCYGTRSYSAIFLIEVERTDPATLAKLYDFLLSGGKIFCVEKYPHKSLGWNKHAENDRQVAALLEKLKAFPDRFIFLQKPADNDFVAWYPAIQKKYKLAPSVSIADPDPYLMVNRYVTDNKSDLFFIINAHLHRSCQTKITFPKEITAGKFAWLWDLQNGERYRIDLDKQGTLDLYLGPVESHVLVFDKEEKGAKWNPLPATGANSRNLEGWDVELRHSLDKSVKNIRMNVLDDLKNTEYANFTGTAVYRKKFTIQDSRNRVLNLGKVYGVSQVKLNGNDLGVTWYGNRLYNLSGKLISGENEIEIHVVTTMGNYMKTLTDNKIAQKWVNRPGRPQPMQSMGLTGPVSLYEA
jgi:hypothetical protein